MEETWTGERDSETGCRLMVRLSPEHQGLSGRSAVEAVKSVVYDNSADWVLLAGFDLQIDSPGDRVALNMDVKKLFLNTDVTVDNSVGGAVPDPVTADVDIDPILFGVGITYEI